MHNTPTCRPFLGSLSFLAELTVEEEMNRARMELEETRQRLHTTVRASAALTVVQTVWLQPGSIVDIKRQCRRVLQMGREDPRARWRCKLLKQNERTGLWAICPTSGRNKGKPYYQDLPVDFFC